MSKVSPRSLETAVIHAGERRDAGEGAVAMPIYQSSTFQTKGGADYHGIRYIRLNNTPNHDILHAKLAALEGCEAALVTSSGMSAITTTLLSLLKQGDHILTQENLYGGTHSFFSHDLADFGISHSFIDSNRPESWAG